MIQKMSLHTYTYTYLISMKLEDILVFMILIMQGVLSQYKLLHVTCKVTQVTLMHDDLLVLLTGGGQDIGF